MVCQDLCRMPNISNRKCRTHTISSMPKFDPKDTKRGIGTTLNTWPQLFRYMKRIPICKKLHPFENWHKPNPDLITQDQFVKVNKKPVCLQILVDRLLRGDSLDTIVLVENRKFACNGLILSTHSKLFMSQRRQSVIDLRKMSLRVCVFDYIYKWMLRSVRSINTNNLVWIIRAAYLLEIPKLLQSCFLLLDSEKFKELAAFNVVYQMRYFDDMGHVNEAVSARISASALMVLCSDQFLQLSVKQVCQILTSSFLAVNSEAEILYAALHWLNTYWPVRCCHVVKVLKCVRFPYLSPILLCHLNELQMDNFGPFGKVIYAFHQTPEAKQLIQDGIFYSAVVITVNDDKSSLKHSGLVRHKLMVPRRWMEDLRCEYHRPVTPFCPNMCYITYDNFAAYSKILKCSSSRYAKFILFPTKNKLKGSRQKIADIVQGPEVRSLMASRCAQMANTTTPSEPCPINFKPSQYWNKVRKLLFREDRE